MIINETSISARVQKKILSKHKSGGIIYLNELKNSFEENDASLSILDITRAVGLPDPPKINGTGDFFNAIGLPQVADVKINSIMDIPLLGDAMKWSSDTFGINWEMNDSPFWRDYGVAIAGVTASILTAGIGTAIFGAGAIAGGLFGTTLTAGAIGGTIGGGIATALATDQKQKYYVRVEQKNLNEQIAEYDTTLAQIQRVKDAQIIQNQDEQLALEQTQKEVEKKLADARLKAILAVATPIAVAVGGGILLMGDVL